MLARNATVVNSLPFGVRLELFRWTLGLKIAMITAGLRDFERLHLDERRRGAFSLLN